MLQRGAFIISRRNGVSIRRHTMALTNGHPLHIDGLSSATRSSSLLASSHITNKNCILGNDDQFCSRRRKNQLLYEFALPRIDLFSSMTTPTNGSNNHRSTTNDDTAAFSSSSSSSSTTSPTLRERFTERSEQGRAAARKGAKSAGEMFRKYGPVFVGTYLGVYVTTLSSLFVGVQSGILDPATLLGLIVDSTDPTTGAAKSTVTMTVELLEHYSWTKPYAPMVEKNPYIANFAVAWISTKFTEPPRLAVTAAVVPRLARYFGFVDKDVDDKVDEAAASASDENKATDDKRADAEQVSTFKHGETQQR